MNIEKNDAMDWTPGEMFRDISNICDNCDTDAGIALTLDFGKNGDEYNVRFRNAGLKNSEAIALLEILKCDLIKMINGG